MCAGVPRENTPGRSVYFGERVCVARGNRGSLGACGAESAIPGGGRGQVRERQGWHRVGPGTSPSTRTRTQLPVDDCVIEQIRIANALSLLPSLSLLGVSLSVTPVVVSAMNRLKPQPSIPELSKSNEPRNLVGLARAVAAGSPSLRFIVIDLSSAKGSTPADRAWFRVFDVKDSRSPHVVRISEVEGRVLAEKMRAFNRYD